MKNMVMVSGVTLEEMTTRELHAPLWWRPPEYQTWRKMTDVPAEAVRKLLMRARAGLDDTPWG